MTPTRGTSWDNGGCCDGGGNDDGNEDGNEDGNDDGNYDDDDAMRSAPAAIVHRHLKQNRSNAFT